MTSYDSVLAGGLSIKKAESYYFSVLDHSVTKAGSLHIVYHNGFVSYSLIVFFTIETTINWLLNWTETELFLS